LILLIIASKRLENPDKTTQSVLTRGIEVRVLPHLLLHFLPFFFVIEQNLAVAEVAALDAALGLVKHGLPAL
jgi:hypothetical protein